MECIGSVAELRALFCRRHREGVELWRRTRVGSALLDAGLARPELADAWFARVAGDATAARGDASYDIQVLGDGKPSERFLLDPTATVHHAPSWSMLKAAYELGVEHGSARRRAQR